MRGRQQDPIAHIHEGLHRWRRVWLIARRQGWRSREVAALSMLDWYLDALNYELLVRNVRLP